MRPDELKVRASALGNIMTFDNATQVTDKQLERITELETKQASKPLTANQAEELEKLIAKRDAPPALSKGAKTQVENIFIEETFEFRKQIDSKYLQKGNRMEDKALAIVSDYLGIPGAVKNETHYANQYIQGTPDWIHRLGFGEGFQADMKNVYYPDRLDGFTSALDPLYEWQGHGYNWMLGFEHGFVVKILQNLPEELIEGEVKNFWKAAGRHWSETIPESFYKEVRDYFDFESRLSLEDRIRIFKVSTTADHIEQMTNAVILAREHYATLPGVWQGRNTENIDFIKSIING